MSVLRFDTTVIGILSGKATLIRHDVPKTLTTIATQSAEEDKLFDQRLFQRVTVTIEDSAQPTAAGRARK